jgi:hypothetical protein
MADLNITVYTRVKAGLHGTTRVIYDNLEMQWRNLSHGHQSHSISTSG